RLVRIGREQRSATRAQRAIGDNLDRAHGEVVVKLSDLRAFAQQAIGLPPRTPPGLVDADVELLLLVELAIDVNVVPRSTRILQFAPAEHDAALVGGDGRFLGIGSGFRRHLGTHQLLRVIEQHAVGFAVFVFGDFSTEWAGSVAIDAGKLKRSGVDDNRVAISAAKNYRVVGSDFVEVTARRKCGRAPESFNPSASADPFTWLGCGHALFHAIQQLLQALSAFQVEGKFTRAHSEKVIVRIGEAGHDGCALQVENARAGADVSLHISIRADEDNLVASHGDGLGMGLAVFDGADVGVLQDKVSGLVLGESTCDQEHSDEQEFHRNNIVTGPWLLALGLWLRKSKHHSVAETQPKAKAHHGDTETPRHREK